MSLVSPLLTLTLALDGAEQAALRVLRFTLRERVNEPFALSLVAGSTFPDLDLKELLLRPASFTIDAEGLHVLGGRRRLTGLCSPAEQLSAEPAGLSLYAFRLVPRLGLLGAAPRLSDLSAPHHPRAP